MPTLPIHNVPLFYIERGAGSPVVLLHGAGGTWRHWGLQVGELAARGRRVLAPDLPGHGRSGGAAGPTIEAYARTVAARLDAMGLAGITLAGHSMGAAVALWMARYYPARLARLVLVGASAWLALGRNPEGRRLRAALAALPAEGLTPPAVAALLAALSHAPGTNAARLQPVQAALAATSAATLCADFAVCDTFDFRTDLSAITLPTLVLTGACDTMTPAEEGEWLAAQLPRARFALIAGAGHMPMLEHPAQVTEWLLEWSSGATEDFPFYP